MVISSMEINPLFLTTTFAISLEIKLLLLDV